MTLIQVMRQCRATLSLIDRADCKDEAVWQKVVDTQSEVDRVLRDGEKQEPVVPEGWKVVPVRPTHEMVRAACDAMGATQSVMRAIEKAPMPPFVGALKFDPARLNELIQNATNAAFAVGEWRDGDEGENIYQLIAAQDAAKDKLVHHIQSLSAPQPAAAPSGDVEPVLWAALNLADRVVYSHESRENVEMNAQYIKTPTRIVGLRAITATKEPEQLPQCLCFTEQQEQYCIRQRKCQGKAVAYGTTKE